MFNRLRWAGVFVVSFCLWSDGVDGQDVVTTNSWLPLSGLDFADNGDLVGWRVNGLGKNSSELVGSAEAFLSLEVSQAGHNLNDEFAWRRIPTSPGKYGQFVGSLADPEIEIRRTYRAGKEQGSIIHEVQVESHGGNLPDDLNIYIAMRPTLQRHTSSDGTLGQIIYGYIRSYGALSPFDGEFESIQEQRQVRAAALAVRHVAVIMAPESIDDESLTINPDRFVTLLLKDIQSKLSYRQLLAAVELSGQTLNDSAFQTILYSDLWGPLRFVARQIEWALHSLTILFSNAGVAVVIFAFVLRIFLLPLGLWSMREQRAFARIQKEMAPKIDYIKSTKKGAERSELILQSYKEFGISPFSGLKGSLGLFVQLPLLIAFFAVTTESSLFRDATFLWASDLSLPDRAMALPGVIPGIGSYINVFPILLGIVSTIAAIIQARSGAVGSPRSGLVLALVFVALFYSCSAALVLYWLVTNLLQIFEGMYVSRTALEVSK